MLGRKHVPNSCASALSHFDVGYSSPPFRLISQRTTQFRGNFSTESAFSLNEDGEKAEIHRRLLPHPRQNSIEKAEEGKKKNMHAHFSKANELPERHALSYIFRPPQNITNLLGKRRQNIQRAECFIVRRFELAPIVMQISL